MADINHLFIAQRSVLAVPGTARGPDRRIGLRTMRYDIHQRNYVADVFAEKSCMVTHIFYYSSALELLGYTILDREIHAYQGDTIHFTLEINIA